MQQNPSETDVYDPDPADPLFSGQATSGVGGVHSPGKQETKQASPAEPRADEPLPTEQPVEADASTLVASSGVEPMPASSEESTLVITHAPFSPAGPVSSPDLATRPGMSSSNALPHPPGIYTQPGLSGI